MLFVVVVYFINIMEDDNELLEMPNYLIAGIMCYSSAVVAMIITAMGMDIHRYYNGMVQFNVILCAAHMNCDLIESEEWELFSSSSSSGGRRVSKVCE